MNIIKRIPLLALSLALLLGLTACGPSGPDMPMEAVVEGHTIVLGQTTTGEMAEWGWEVEFNGSQNEVRSDAKYVACYYHIKVDGGGAGKEFWVDVYVPFYKNFVGSSQVDLSSEEKLSKTMGVAFRVTLRKSATDELKVSYNDTDLQSLTWAVAEEWGAKVEEDAYGSKDAEMEAAQGTLKFKKSYTDPEVGELTITMDTNSFSKLQK